jgi:PE family/PPE-SVP subfamily C-terminal region
LDYAAGKLEGIGTSLAAQNASAAASTTGAAPAAADEVSALQATQFTAYGNLYQQISAEATAIHQAFVQMLGTSAGSYGATEAANSAATGLSSGSGGFSLWGQSTQFGQFGAIPGAMANGSMVGMAGGNPFIGAASNFSALAQAAGSGGVGVDGASAASAGLGGLSAMYGYAGSSASAATLNPLTSPAPTTNPAGAGAQSAAVSTAGTQSQLSQLISNLPTAMQSLASTGTTSSSSSEGFLNDLFSSGGNIGMYNYSGVAVGFGASGIMGGLGLGAAQSSSAAAATAPAGLGAGLGGALAGTVAPAGTASLGGTPVLAGMAQSSSVGGLSVPATWSAATPESSAEALTTADWHADVDEGGGVTNVATGMPAVASTGRGSHGFSTPRYGVKPTVMPTRVLV